MSMLGGNPKNSCGYRCLALLNQSDMRLRYEVVNAAFYSILSEEIIQMSKPLMSQVVTNPAPKCS